MREDYHPFANDERTKPFLDGSRLIRLWVEILIFGSGQWGFKTQELNLDESPKTSPAKR